MEAVSWVVASAVLFLASVTVLRRVVGKRRDADGRAERAVLPTTYDGQNLFHDYSASPGWCPHCETRRETEYRYCGDCGTKLVGGGSRTGEWP